MFKIKQNIPNAITSGNLLCGCLAIVKAFEGDLVWAAYLVGIAAVLDFFDGFAARLLKVSSPIGKDLDSLADMVTFGVVPSVVMFQMIKNSMGVFYVSDIFVGSRPDGGSLIPYIAFVIAVFSGIRLAKFNNDTRQSDSFIGVPTPANAMLICSLPLILESCIPHTGWTIYPPLSAIADTAPPETYLSTFFLMNPYVLIALTLIMSFLLVSELPLFALKFKNFGWADNKIRYIFLTCCLILLVCLQVVAIPIIILLYILFSVVNNLAAKQKNR